MIKDVLKKYNIKPSKKLGQNFLVDELVLEKIIAASELSKNDTVLEIGPGLGILTLALAKKVKRVIAVEKDQALCQALENILRGQKINNVKILNADILQTSNYSNLPNYSNYKLIANLPYYIVSPVIRMFLENPLAGKRPKIMVLMVQKEVAQRICATPGQMSILAVAVQFYSQPEIISIVPKTSFYPQPKVDSAILRIKPRIDANEITNINELDTEKFFNLVRMGFSSKRKFLINNFKKRFGVQGSKFEDLFRKLEINTKSRAENLSIEDWLKIYENIKNYT